MKPGRYNLVELLHSKTWNVVSLMFQHRVCGQVSGAAAECGGQRGQGGVSHEAGQVLYPLYIYIIYNTPLISTQVPGGVRPLPRPPPRPPRQPGAGAAAGEVMSPPGSPGGGSAALPPRPGPGTHTSEKLVQGWGQVIPLYLDMSLIHEVWNPIARYINI